MVVVLALLLVHTSSHALVCERGSYIEHTASSSQCAICPPGHFCPDGVAYEACPPGTRRAAEGGASVEGCAPCDAGSLCAERGTAEEVAPCPPGHYCPAATLRAQPCPAGTYRPVGADSFSAADCQACPGGYHCGAAAVVFRGCPAGKLCPAGASDAPQPCPAGSFCPPNSRAAQRCPAGSHCGADAAAPTRCPVGSWCAAGAAAPTLCPAGTASASSRLMADRRTADEACSPCAPGSVDAHPRRERCHPCPPGAHCAGGAAPSAACPAGSYCPLGSAAPLRCPAGTASATRGAVSRFACAACPVEHFAARDGSATCRACPGAPPIDEAAPSAVEGSGATSCACAGRGRIFLPATATCGCARGWTPSAVRLFLFFVISYG